MYDDTFGKHLLARSELYQVYPCRVSSSIQFIGEELVGLSAALGDYCYQGARHVVNGYLVAACFH